MSNLEAVTFIELGARAENLAGGVFNYLTVLGPVENNKRNIKWLCQCVCGNTTIVYGSNLKNGKTRSCGCNGEGLSASIVTKETTNMNELVARTTELASDIGFTDEISWIAPADLTLDKYLSIANTFQQIQKSLGFWYGDLLNTGEQLFGEDFAQAIPEIGKASETLVKYKAVAARVPRSIRRPGLPWVHHFYVAYVEEDQRGDLLEMAENMGLSSRELKEVAKLDYDLRYDLMVAAAEGIEREGFMALLNRFKMGVIDKPKKDKKIKDDDEEDTEDEDFSDDEDNSDDDAVPQNGMDVESVTDWWENAETPLVFCGPKEAIWQGLMVTASLDKWGSPILVWEEVK